jgi:hypothetical protein
VFHLIHESLYPRTSLYLAATPIRTSRRKCDEEMAGRWTGNCYFTFASCRSFGGHTDFLFVEDALRYTCRLLRFT